MKTIAEPDLAPQVAQRPVILENDVVNAVAEYLEQQGFQVTERALDGAHGYDIAAARDGLRLLVEAKGSGPKKPLSKSKRSHFTKNQCRQSVEAGLFKLASLYDSGCRLSLALPQTSEYAEVIAKIGAALSRLGIGVYWVTFDRRVHFQDFGGGA